MGLFDAVSTIFRARSGLPADWLDEVTPFDWVELEHFRTLLVSFADITGFEQLRAITRLRMADAEHSNFYAPVLRSWIRSFGHSVEHTLRCVGPLWRAAFRNIAPPEVLVMAPGEVHLLLSGLMAHALYGSQAMASGFEGILLGNFLGYLGMVPVIAYLQVFYSEANSDEARSSQLFHCDADATSQVKIFVLCSEVTRSNGPLTLLDAETSRNVRSRLGYHFGGKIKDKRLAGIIDESDHVPIVGPPGTVCFVDTTQCFHFGSRVESGTAPRLVTMIQYLTPSSFMLPRDHRQGSPFRQLASRQMGRVQRMVLGAE